MLNVKNILNEKHVILPNQKYRKISLIKTFFKLNVL